MSYIMPYLIRHNGVKDLTAELLSEFCHNVEVKPHLQPLNGENFQYKTANTQDGARLDISMKAFVSLLVKAKLLTFMQLVCLIILLLRVTTGRISKK